MMLEVQDLTKTYGTGDKAHTALAGVTFSVAEGEFVCIVGPSGCGKTTLLKCLAGLRPASSGQVRLLGNRVTRPPKELALVFQDYSRSLMPWMSVRKNVLFPLRHHGSSRAQRKALADRALESVGLSGAGDRYPWQLSGGMQQRVAIARSLAYQPRVLLMDEPFASVDAQTRADLEDIVLQVRHEFGVTVVFVTHDIDEAVYLSDRFVVLGGTPTQVRESLNIDLPRPRDQLTTKELPEFGQWRSRLYRLVKRLPAGNSIVGKPEVPSGSVPPYESA